MIYCFLCFPPKPPGIVDRGHNCESQDTEPEEENPYR